jgi:hypothetical protein
MTAIAEIASEVTPIGRDFAPSQPARAAVDIKDVLDDADLLLRHAAEVGLDVKPEVITAIEEARAASAARAWAAEIAGKFWPAYGALCNLAKPVTAESLAASSNGALKHSLRRYRRWTLWLILLILPVSVVMFLNTSISNELSDRIKETDALETSLHDRLVALTGAQAPPATALSQPLAAAAAERDTATMLHHFITSNNILLWRGEVLNWFILRTEQIPNLGWLSPTADPPSDGSDRYKLQALREYGFKWIDAYQNIRVFAKGVQQSNLVYYGAITAYLLPVLYALLGALAYGLRCLSQEATARTYVPSYISVARISTAIIAGLVVGLFNNFTQGVSLSPLAIAFLVGYAVEIFFSFLDSFLDSLKKVRS